MHTQSLTGVWQFHPVGKDEWLEAHVPGGVHTDLMAAHRLPDDAREYKIGLRTLELRQQPDQWGRSFTFTAVVHRRQSAPAGDSRHQQFARSVNRDCPLVA